MAHKERLKAIQAYTAFWLEGLATKNILVGGSCGGILAQIGEDNYRIQDTRYVPFCRMVCRGIDKNYRQFCQEDG